MDRKDRFLVIASIFQDVWIRDSACGLTKEVGCKDEWPNWGELEDAIAKHERECLPLPEEETNGNEGKDHNPAQSTGPAESELRGIDPGGGLDNWDF